MTDSGAFVEGGDCDLPPHYSYYNGQALHVSRLFVCQSVHNPWVYILYRVPVCLLACISRYLAKHCLFPPRPSTLLTWFVTRGWQFPCSSQIPLYDRTVVSEMNKEISKPLGESASLLSWARTYMIQQVVAAGISSHNPTTTCQLWPLRDRAERDTTHLASAHHAPSILHPYITRKCRRSHEFPYIVLIFCYHVKTRNHSVSDMRFLVLSSYIAFSISHGIKICTHTATPPSTSGPFGQRLFKASGIMILNITLHNMPEKLLFCCPFTTGWHFQSADCCLYMYSCHVKIDSVNEFNSWLT